MWTARSRNKSRERLPNNAIDHKKRFHLNLLMKRSILPVSYFWQRTRFERSLRGLIVNKNQEKKTIELLKLVRKIVKFHAFRIWKIRNVVKSWKYLFHKSLAFRWQRSFGRQQMILYEFIDRISSSIVICQPIFRWLHLISISENEEVGF